jgi:hypothetical protein
MTARDRETGYTRQNFSVITNARVPSSEEMSGRIRRYTITMAFRTACFVAMIFVPGIWRWLLFAGAVFLPYIAVLFANQAQQRGMSHRVEAPPAPDDAPRITAGPEDLIQGDVDDRPDDTDRQQPRGAYGGSDGESDGESDGRPGEAGTSDRQPQDPHARFP